MQLKVSVVLMRKLCNAKVCHSVVQGCKHVNRSRNGRFRYEMRGEIQPEMELLAVVTYHYPFSLKAGSSIPSPTRIQFFNTVSLDFMCSPKFFLKNNLGRCMRTMTLIIGIISTFKSVASSQEQQTDSIRILRRD